MSKFYKAAWYRLACKWSKIMQANSFGKFTLYKTGPDGKVYEKVVYDKDWKSKAGYEPNVESSSEQESDDVKAIQKFSVVMQQFPNNTALRKILQQRELKLLDLTAAELQEVQDAQDQADQMDQQMAMAGAHPTQGAAPAQPQQEQGGVDPNQLQELQQLMSS